MSRHHQAIKNSPEWKAARAACLNRDEHRCIRCGETERLEADHIIRLSDAPELGTDVNNLQTLCTDCHDEKEREYQAQQLERREWVNNAYPELTGLRESKEEERTELFL